MINVAIVEDDARIHIGEAKGVKWLRHVRIAVKFPRHILQGVQLEKPDVERCDTQHQHCPPEPKGTPAWW